MVIIFGITMKNQEFLTMSLHGYFYNTIQLFNYTCSFLTSMEKMIKIMPMPQSSEQVPAYYITFIVLVGTCACVCKCIFTYAGFSFILPISPLYLRYISNLAIDTHAPGFLCPEKLGPEVTNISHSSKVYLEIAMTKMRKTMTVDGSFKLHELSFDKVSCQTVCWHNIQLLKD